LSLAFLFVNVGNRYQITKDELKKRYLATGPNVNVLFGPIGVTAGWLQLEESFRLSTESLGIPYHPVHKFYAYTPEIKAQHELMRDLLRVWENFPTLKAFQIEPRHHSSNNTQQLYWEAWTHTVMRKHFKESYDLEENIRRTLANEPDSEVIGLLTDWYISKQSVVDQMEFLTGPGEPLAPQRAAWEAAINQFKLQLESTWGQ
jgi:hypothetical protein